jgi:hypothetical protein
VELPARWWLVSGYAPSHPQMWWMIAVASYALRPTLAGRVLRRLVSAYVESVVANW